MGTIAARTISQHKLNETVIVGKDVLELLSSAMYVDPLCIYREYIQNAADAIDEAETDGLYLTGPPPRIDVSLDLAKREIRIRDNGTGIPPHLFSRRLTSLGASKKRGSNARGFRGVGRLSGLAYCEQLIFRSKCATATRVWEIRWSCRRLKELLRDQSYKGDLHDALHETIEFDTFEEPASRSHFFEVELKQVNRVKNDILLNQTAVEDYLSQVGPVPFASAFSFGPRISTFLRKHSLGSSYPIYINHATKALSRPFRNKFAAKRNLEDKFTNLELFEIPGVTGGVDGVGWLLHHNYYGAVPDNVGVKGLRLRAGNIQLGGADIFESSFPEPRFNGWTVGEIHILSKHLVPNGRRDELEQNIHHQNLLNHVRPLARTIAKVCRRKSAQRNKNKMMQKTGSKTGRISGPPNPDTPLRGLDLGEYLTGMPTAHRFAFMSFFSLLCRYSSTGAHAKRIILSILKHARAALNDKTDSRQQSAKSVAERPAPFERRSKRSR